MELMDLPLLRTRGLRRKIPSLAASHWAFCATLGLNWMKLRVVRMLRGFTTLMLLVFKGGRSPSSVVCDTRTLLGLPRSWRKITVTKVMGDFPAAKVQLHEIAQTPQGDPLIVMEFCHWVATSLLSWKENSANCEVQLAEVKRPCWSWYIVRNTTCPSVKSSTSSVRWGKQNNENTRKGWGKRLLWCGFEISLSWDFLFVCLSVWLVGWGGGCGYPKGSPGSIQVRLDTNCWPSWGFVEFSTFGDDLLENKRW